MYQRQSQQSQQNPPSYAKDGGSGTFHQSQSPNQQGGGCRSLMITNLDPRVDDMLLTQVLGVAGQVVQIRLVPDRLNPGHPLAYVDFADHAGAETAMATLAGQKIYDFPITIQWNFQQAPKKEDTSSHYHIWVGDLAADVEDPMLVRMFAVFPSMSDARIMWDQQTGK